VEAVSQRLKEVSVAEALRRQRPVIYLEDNDDSKEDLARFIAQRDEIGEGLISVLTAVEV
jgi:hypothetical protein